MTDADAMASRLIECQYANGHLLCYANRRAAIASIIAAALRSRDAEWQAKVDEAEAQAAAMRPFIEDYARQLRLDGCLTGIFDKAECEKMAQEAEAAISPTAGRGCADDNSAQANHLVAHTLTANGHDASEDGTGRETPLVPVWAIQERAVCENPESGPQGKGYQEDRAFTLEARHHTQDVAFAQNQRDEVRTMNVAGALGSEPGMKQQTYIHHQGVRRIMPIECERLQGFPDGWTEGHSDSARYRMLGNSVAVPVAEYIGTRLVAACEGRA